MWQADSCWRLVSSVSITESDAGDLVVLGVWLAAAVVLHDGLIAPLTVGTGVALTRVPARARRHLQGALPSAR